VRADLAEAILFLSLRHRRAVRRGAGDLPPQPHLRRALAGRRPLLPLRHLRPAGAHLIAILQIIVYAGAVMVLFVFVSCSLNLKEEELAAADHGWEGRRLAAVVASFGVIAWRALVRHFPKARSCRATGAWTTPCSSLDSAASRRSAASCYLARSSVRGDSLLRLVRWSRPGVAKGRI